MHAFRENPNETNTGFIMLTANGFKDTFGKLLLTRNICTGKLTEMAREDMGKLDKQVYVFSVIKTNKLDYGDAVIMNHFKSIDYPHFYIDFIYTSPKISEGAVYYKIIGSSSEDFRKKGKFKHVSLTEAIMAFPEELYITQEMVTKVGFTIVSDDGQYLKAKEIKSKVNVLRELSLNREGSHMDLRTDGDTGTTFSGKLSTVEDFFTIIKCAY